MSLGIYGEERGGRRHIDRPIFGPKTRGVWLRDYLVTCLFPPIEIKNHALTVPQGPGVGITDIRSLLKDANPMA